MVNLEKILEENSNINKDEDGNLIYYLWEVKKAMKQACEQTIDLCAENADVEVVDTEFNSKFGQRFPIWGVSSESILNVKKLIK